MSLIMALKTTNENKSTISNHLKSLNLIKSIITHPPFIQKTQLCIQELFSHSFHCYLKLFNQFSTQLIPHA